MKLRYFVLVLILFPGLLFAAAKEISEYEWEGVERIVAIGDIHGDYDNYMATLTAAGLVDKKGKWAGGKTHLVQTGDIPDRGPDTQRIIEHITRLAKQAKRKGGRVHSLIGNHEAMNVYGDLRYVHKGEFEAFVTRNSEKLRDRYFDLYMESMQQNEPEQFAALPEDYREQWNEQYPLGWLEHRQAWDPAWNPEGKLANWVLERKVVIKVNGNLFLHGGLSGFYCQNSLESMTEKVTDNLRHFDPADSGILEDDFGPLWYRGLSGVEPQALPETVNAILAHHDASHIVVGHTPTRGVIWPQYDSKVLMIDTGISKAYGGYVAYLEITPEGYFAGYPAGKLKLPDSDEGAIPYLKQVIGMQPGNPHLKKRLENLTAPVEPKPVDPAATAEGQPEAKPEPARVPPICGIS
jgi:hypothetical protein